MNDYRTSSGQHVPGAKPHEMRDYRVWFDHNLGRWFIGMASNPKIKGVMIEEPPKFGTLDVTCHPDGSQTCTAELLLDGQTFIPGTRHVQSAKRAVLRLLRTFDQIVTVPLMSC